MQKSKNWKRLTSFSSDLWGIGALFAIYSIYRQLFLNDNNAINQYTIMVALLFMMPLGWRDLKIDADKLLNAYFKKNDWIESKITKLSIRHGFAKREKPMIANLSDVEFKTFLEGLGELFVGPKLFHVKRGVELLRFYVFEQDLTYDNALDNLEAELLNFAKQGFYGRDTWKKILIGKYNQIEKLLHKVTK